ncbi:MAG: hypothetical protein PHU85_17050 [Phycisphaerae bacterium]|nr:hypothetical protein [Phycisphaerae bacterium]
MAYNINIGPCQTTTPGATFGVPIGPYASVPVAPGTMHEAAGGIAALSSFSARLAQTYAVRVQIDAVALAAGRVQHRAAVYVPAQALAEPYPVPNLDDYAGRGGSFAPAVRQWAADLVQWRQDHARRVLRDLARIQAEKSNEWVEV